jgi:hypothetical protein
MFSQLGGLWAGTAKVNEMVLVVADWENSPGLQFRDVMFEGRDRSPRWPALQNI